MFAFPSLGAGRQAGPVAVSEATATLTAPLAWEAHVISFPHAALNPNTTTASQDAVNNS
jgi:hypothetical protein